VTTITIDIAFDVDHTSRNDRSHGLYLGSREVFTSAWTACNKTLAFSALPTQVALNRSVDYMHAQNEVYSGILDAWSDCEYFEPLFKWTYFVEKALGALEAQVHVHNCVR
jgi:hypothetical protein